MDIRSLALALAIVLAPLAAAAADNDFGCATCAAFGTPVPVIGSQYLNPPPPPQPFVAPSLPRIEMPRSPVPAPVMPSYNPAPRLPPLPPAPYWDDRD